MTMMERELNHSTLNHSTLKYTPQKKLWTTKCKGYNFNNFIASNKTKCWYKMINSIHKQKNVYNSVWLL